MNVLTKINLFTWYAGKKVGAGVKRVFNLALSNPKAWDRSLWNLRGSQSLSGETVTEETALTYSAFYCGVNLISGTIGTLPLHLMQKTGKTNRNAEEKPLYNVMHNQWNPYMTAEIGRTVMAAHILTWGNGYAEIVRNKMGIVELWPIPPNRVTPKLEDGKLIYEIKMDGEADIYLNRDKVLHIPGLGFDGFIGYSVVAMARKSIGLGMAMESFGSLFFGSGTHPGVVVTHPQSLDTVSYNNMKNALTEEYSGLGQSHRLMLLEQGLKIEKIGVSPEDSQFLESRQFQIPEIARWLNLPPHKLKDLTKSSFNNIESEQISFVTDSILPWLVRIEANYRMQLLTPAEQKIKYYFKHIVEGLLRANSKDRAEYYKIMIGNTIMTPNEARDKEDMNPSTDPLADELWAATGLIPLSKFDEYLSKNNSTQEEKPEEPAGEELEEEPDETGEARAILKLLHGDKK